MRERQVRFIAVKHPSFLEDVYALHDLPACYRRELDRIRKSADPIQRRPMPLRRAEQSCQVSKRFLCPSVTLVT